MGEIHILAISSSHIGKRAVCRWMWATHNNNKTHWIMLSRVYKLIFLAVFYAISIFHFRLNIFFYRITPELIEWERNQKTVQSIQLSYTANGDFESSCTKRLSQLNWKKSDDFISSTLILILFSLCSSFTNILLLRLSLFFVPPQHHRHPAIRARKSK